MKEGIPEILPAALRDRFPDPWSYSIGPTPTQLFWNIPSQNPLPDLLACRQLGPVGGSHRQRLLSEHDGRLPRHVQHPAGGGGVQHVRHAGDGHQPLLPRQHHPGNPPGGFGWSGHCCSAAKRSAIQSQPACGKPIAAACDPALLSLGGWLALNRNLAGNVSLDLNGYLWDVFPGTVESFSYFVAVGVNQLLWLRSWRSRHSYAVQFALYFCFQGDPAHR